MESHEWLSAQHSVAFIYIILKSKLSSTAFIYRSASLKFPFTPQTKNSWQTILSTDAHLLDNTPVYY